MRSRPFGSKEIQPPNGSIVKLWFKEEPCASRTPQFYFLSGFGSFYSGVDFDHELIRVLSTSALQYITRKEKATAAEVHSFISSSGLIRGQPLTVEDVEKVLQALVYDSKAESTHDPRHGSEKVYRIVPKLSSIEYMVDSFTSLPSATCECSACLEDMGQPCLAMDAWLDAAARKACPEAFM